MLLLVGEALTLLALSRLLGAAPVVVFLGAFWGLAMVFYFNNYRILRWLQRGFK